MFNTSENEDQKWTANLSQALEVANLPTLLMVLVHLTGDRKWLSSRYECSYIRGLDENASGGLSDEVQKEIRDAAFIAITEWKAGKAVAFPDPNVDELVKMFTTSVGEEVPASYGPMLSSWFGLDPEFAIDQKGQFQVPENFQVVVIGAGVAGICAAIRLQGAGIPYVVIEKNPEAGGTWYENYYPGCGVDTPNHIYSFSFAKADWTKYFALQDEIQRYFLRVVKEFNLRPNIRFNTSCESLRYDATTQSWSVSIVNADGVKEDLTANIVISAVGILNIPKYPKIKGLENFKGECFHTARWPKDLELKGKRVGIIGNGASSMQVVPAIADEVEHLSVFQRSKQWAAPFDQFQKNVPLDIRFLLKEVPYYQEWYRQRLSWIFNDRIHASLQIDPDWPDQHQSINYRNERHREYFTSYIKEELGDRQDLLEQVLPDYPPFGKRMLMDNGWYRTMTKDNVSLINSGITQIDENGLITADGKHHECDVLIIATGFDAVNFLSSLDVYGKDGKSIRDRWDAHGAEAYLGMTTPNFPNLFILAGPNTALGHGGSVVASLEIQVRYILGILKQAMDLAQDKNFEIEVKRDVHDAFNERVQEAHNKMIWSHKGMSNWYRNNSGKIIAPTPFRNDDYWHMLYKTNLQDFNLKVESSSEEKVQNESALMR